MTVKQVDHRVSVAGGHGVYGKVPAFQIQFKLAYELHAVRTAVIGVLSVKPVSGDLIRNLFDSGITVEYKNPSTKKYEKLTWDEDFEVVGYQNNVNKGTMTVYIRAKDDSTKVSGVKNFKIKISAKTMKKAD